MKSYSSCAILIGLFYLAYVLKVHMKVKVTQSCLTLWYPMYYRVHGILQARILEWVAFPFSRGSSQHRGRTQVSCTAGWFFTIWVTSKAPYFHFSRFTYIVEYVRVYFLLNLNNTSLYVYKPHLFIHSFIDGYLVCFHLLAILNNVAMHTNFCLSPWFQIFWVDTQNSWKKMKVLVFQLCPTLWDSIDNSPPSSSVYGILQARILEWVAIPFSRGSSWPRDWTPSPTFQADSLLSKPGSYGNSMFKFFRNNHTIFRSVYTILHSNQ